MRNKRTGETLKFYRRVLVNGKWKLEHRVIAEQVIGRPLKRKEVVHHVDENKLNNSPDNLMVFDSLNSHAAFHQGAELIALEDGTFRAEPRARVERIRVYNPKTKTKRVKTTYRYESKCSCGSVKSISAKQCVNCYQAQLREESNKPSKQVIEALLLTDIPYLHLGTKFGVSDNGFRKWCKFYGLPRTVKARKEYKLVAKLKQAA